MAVSLVLHRVADYDAWRSRIRERLAQASHRPTANDAGAPPHSVSAMASDADTTSNDTGAMAHVMVARTACPAP